MRWKNGLGPPASMLTTWRLRRRSSRFSRSSGLKTMPPAHRDPHPVDRAVGAAPHQGQPASGAKDPGDLGHGPLLVDPVPGGGGEDHVEGRALGRELLGPAGPHVDAGSRGAQHGPHAPVGLDREARAAPVRPGAWSAGRCPPRFRGHRAHPSAEASRARPGAVPIEGGRTLRRRHRRSRGARPCSRPGAHPESTGATGTPLRASRARRTGSPRGPPLARRGARPAR